MDGEANKVQELKDYIEKVRGHLRQRQEKLKLVEGELALLQLEITALQRSKPGKVSGAAELRGSEQLRSSLGRKVERKRTECEQARAELETARDRLSQAEKEFEQLHRE